MHAFNCSDNACHALQSNNAATYKRARKCYDVPFPPYIWTIGIEHSHWGEYTTLNCICLAELKRGTCMLVSTHVCDGHQQECGYSTNCTWHGSAPAYFTSCNSTVMQTVSTAVHHPSGTEAYSSTLELQGDDFSSPPPPVARPYVPQSASSLHQSFLSTFCIL